MNNGPSQKYTLQIKRPFEKYKLQRGSAMVTRRSHKPEIVGPIPIPAIRPCDEHGRQFGTAGKCGRVRRVGGALYKHLGVPR